MAKVREEIKGEGDLIEYLVRMELSKGFGIMSIAESHDLPPDLVKDIANRYWAELAKKWGGNEQ